MPNTPAEPAAEYRCPGQQYTISRAIHLGRLASFFPPCRTCPLHDDTGELSPRTLRRLEETRGRGQQTSLFFEEGMAGVCPNQFGPAAARQAAIALGMYLQQQQSDTPDAPVVLIAGDGRPMTAELQAAVGEGLRWAGCHVVDLGAATAPCMAMGIDHLQAAGGLLVGNPTDRPQNVGLKFWAPGARPLSSGSVLDQLAAMYGSPVDRPTRTFGSWRRFQADEPYLASLADQYHALRPLRILLDTQCRPLAGYLGRLTAAVACEVLTSESRVVGTTQAGHGQIVGPCAAGTGGQAASGTQALPKGTGTIYAKHPSGRCAANGASPQPAEHVVAQAAHFGVAVRDDGEVCRFCDERGREVPGDRLLLLLAREQLRQRPGATIVVEPDTSPQVVETLAAWGGHTVVAGPRRVALDAAMRQTAAVLGGGPSGRFWFAVSQTAPDALRALTQVLVLLSRSDRRFSEVLDAEAAV